MKTSFLEFTAKYCSRFNSGNSSKPPAKARHSRFFLLQAVRLTRCTKSNIPLKGPFFSRSSMIFSTAPSPTPFTAPRPKRIFPSGLTVNFRLLSFTSGPRTLIPIALHSSISLVISVMFDKLRLITAAIYSAG